MIRSRFAFKSTVPSHYRRNVVVLASSQLCNNGKGIMGERALAKVITRICGDLEVLDTSSKPAHSDLHVVAANGSFIAFECKNKGIITKTDTEKSCRDIAYMKDVYGEQFIRYVFVSLRSRNIPHRRFFEFVADIPTFWYGSDEHDAVESGDEVLEKVVQIALKVSNDFAYSKNKPSMSQLVESSAFANDVQELYERISFNSKTISATKATIHSLSKQLQSMQENNDKMLSLLDGILRRE